MLGSLGLLLSSLIKQLENFAGVMNFVIFPMFFAVLGALPDLAPARGEPASPRSPSSTPSPTPSS
jgi:ABC-2 type transport system permease protein